jgi:hypothetical protein
MTWQSLLATVEALAMAWAGNSLWRPYAPSLSLAATISFCPHGKASWPLSKPYVLMEDGEMEDGNGGRNVDGPARLETESGLQARETWGDRKKGIRPTRRTAFFLFFLSYFNFIFNFSFLFYFFILFPNFEFQFFEYKLESALNSKIKLGTQSKIQHDANIHFYLSYYLIHLSKFHSYEEWEITHSNIIMFFKKYISI